MSFAPETCTQAAVSAPAASVTLKSWIPSTWGISGEALRVIAFLIPKPFASLSRRSGFAAPVTSRTTSFSGRGRFEYLHRLFHARLVYDNLLEGLCDQERAPVLEDVPAVGHTDRADPHDPLGGPEERFVGLSLRPSRKYYRDGTLSDDLPECLLA